MCAVSLPRVAGRRCLATVAVAFAVVLGSCTKPDNDEIEPEKGKPGTEVDVTPTNPKDSVILDSLRMDSLRLDSIIKAHLADSLNRIQHYLDSVNNAQRIADSIANAKAEAQRIADSIAEANLPINIYNRAVKKIREERNVEYPGIYEHIKEGTVFGYNIREHGPNRCRDTAQMIKFMIDRTIPGPGHEAYFAGQKDAIDIVFEIRDQLGKLDFYMTMALGRKPAQEDKDMGNDAFYEMMSLIGINLIPNNYKNPAMLQSRK